MLMTDGGVFLCVCFSPPGFSPCKACLGRGWEVSRGCARDVVGGIQTMSAWVSLHPVELQAVECPAQASPSLSVRPGEQNTLKSPFLVQKGKIGLDCSLQCFV